jgi:hypothetical protein
MMVRQHRKDVEGFRLLTQVADMGFPKAKQVMALLKPTVPKANVNLDLSVKENKDKLQDETLEGEVITIVADTQDPIAKFEGMLNMIQAMTLYNERGMSGTRVGDVKCGQVGSFCRIDNTTKIQ